MAFQTWLGITLRGVWGELVVRGSIYLKAALPHCKPSQSTTKRDLYSRLRSLCGEKKGFTTITLLAGRLPHGGACSSAGSCHTAARVDCLGTFSLLWLLHCIVTSSSSKSSSFGQGTHLCIAAIKFCLVF